MCTTSEEPDYYIIKGRLDNAAQQELILQELTTKDLLPVDSFETDDKGSFSYRGNLEEAGFFILRVDRTSYITLVIEPGEELFIRGDADNLPLNHSVEGSEGSERLSELKQHLQRNHQKVDSLADIFHASKYDDDFMEVRRELDQAYEEILKNQQDYVKQFIEDNPRSLASLIALYQYFGDRLLLRESEHFSYFEDLSRSLSQAYPANKHVLDLNRRVSRHKRNEARRRLSSESLSEGNEAPEIVLPDPDGQMIALSDFRGKHVLIDFWAAWSPPCRESNQRLKAIYQEYKARGFEIYGVSLDPTKEQWLKAIDEDEITWTQVSDQRFWNSPVVNLYHIESIPYAILIDPEGKIVQKDISPQELRDTLSSRLDE
ncbi:MAG: AhpC/TSA family protein [Bacteroidales bacterium]